MKKSILTAQHRSEPKRVEGTIHDITPECGWTISVHARKDRGWWVISDIATGRKITDASTRHCGLSQATEILRDIGRVAFTRLMVGREKINII